MHLENILMHLFNTLMVFLIANKLCRRNISNFCYLPFLAAAIFALHPINTESVNWISGRTDTMSCMFVLVGLWLLIKYSERRNFLLLFCSFIVGLMGVLAKETALGFIPAATLILLALYNKRDAMHDGVKPDCRTSGVLFLSYTSAAFLAALVWVNYYVVILIGVVYCFHYWFLLHKEELTVNILHRLKAIMLVAVACFLLVIIFYGLRKIAFVSDISRISETLKVMTADMNYTIELFMGAAGFYVKKFFIPTPLNIGIREVDPLYELFGVICFLGCMHLILLRRIESAMVVAGFFMLAPAFPIAFGTIAWTGYAERYDYIPSAFWILGISGFCNAYSYVIVKKYKQVLISIVLICVLFFAVTTVQRNLVWQNNLDFFKDAVEKSPEFKNVRGLYMSALFDKKMYDEVEKQYFASKNIYSLKYDERYDLMYASLLTLKKKYKEAEVLYDQIEKKTNGQSSLLYESKINFYNACEDNETDQHKKHEFAYMKLNAFEHLYNLNKSSTIGYKLGQAYCMVGEREKAIKTIRASLEQMKFDDPQRLSAERFLRTLVGSSN